MSIPAYICYKYRAKKLLWATQLTSNCEHMSKDTNSLSYKSKKHSFSKQIRTVLVSRREMLKALTLAHSRDRVQMK